jgi:hypothetical protein
MHFTALGDSPIFPSAPPHHRPPLPLTAFPFGLAPDLVLCSRFLILDALVI